MNDALILKNSWNPVRIDARSLNVSIFEFHSRQKSELWLMQEAWFLERIWIDICPPLTFATIQQQPNVKMLTISLSPNMVIQFFCGCLITWECKLKKVHNRCTPLPPILRICNQLLRAKIDDETLQILWLRWKN